MTNFPLPSEVWSAVAEHLALPPQQKRIVELLLSGKQDKEIAAALQIRLPTLRTYLARIFERTGTADRMQLVLHVFSVAQEQGIYSRES